MKTIIAGGRDHVFTGKDFWTLDALRMSLPITEVVSGGATGADRMGEIWAEARQLPLTKKRPNTMGGLATYKEACLHRNQEMADYAQALVAFPGGSGTADMIRRANAKGLKVVIVNRKGE